MAAIDLKSLIGRLNEPCRRALEAAAGLTLSRTHYNVEIEHWLLKLADAADGDVAAILRHYEIDQGRLTADLNRALDHMKTGNARAPSLSPDIIELVKQAWLLASVEHNAAKLRSGHLLWALLADESLARRAREASGQLLRIPVEALKRDFAAVTANSSEAASAAPSADTGAPAGSGVAASAGSGALGQFTIDLTAMARAGKIDPILGRDGEIRQIVDILTRRRQNNPILTGEAGVGKTAVVEGFAARVAQGDVPPSLREVTVRTLDLGLLQAGAGVRGEFENRLKSVIEEVRASPHPIILFIDEAHTLIGAGGAAGQGDAANLLKPALARGELRTIAATTWAEYKKYFETDAALTRRFQVVKIEEPGEATAVAMIRGLVGTLEEHHKVRILDEALTRSGATVGPLHPEPAIARQGGVADRHRLRAGGDEPVCGAGCDRGPAAAARLDRHRDRDHRPRDRDRGRPRRAPGRTRRRTRSGRGRSRSTEPALGERKAARRRDRRGAAGDRKSRCERRRRKWRRRGRSARASRRGKRRLARHPRRAAADLPGRRWAGGCRDRRGLDRHSGRPHAVGRDPHRAAFQGGDGTADDRPAAGARRGGAGDPSPRAPA